MARMRIHKALANAGVASRRAVEEMILDGRISVNGKLVIELPCFVDLEADEVRVDGQRVRPAKPHPLNHGPGQRGPPLRRRVSRDRPATVRLFPHTKANRILANLTRSLDQLAPSLVGQPVGQRQGVAAQLCLLADAQATALRRHPRALGPGQSVRRHRLRGRHVEASLPVWALCACRAVRTARLPFTGSGARS